MANYYHKVTKDGLDHHVVSDLYLLASFSQKEHSEEFIELYDPCPFTCWRKYSPYRLVALIGVGNDQRHILDHWEPIIFCESVPQALKLADLLKIKSKGEFCLNAIINHFRAKGIPDPLRISRVLPSVGEGQSISLGSH